MEPRCVYVTAPVRWTEIGDLVIGDSIGAGTKLRTPPGFEATITSLGPAVKAAGFEPYIEIAIVVGAPVVSQLIANWLWDHFHDHAAAIMIDGATEPEIDIVLDANGVPEIATRPRLSVDRTIVELDDEGRAKRIIRERIDRVD